MLWNKLSENSLVKNPKTIRENEFFQRKFYFKDFLPKIYISKIWVGVFISVLKTWFLTSKKDFNTKKYAYLFL